MHNPNVTKCWHGSAKENGKMVFGNDFLNNHNWVRRCMTCNSAPASVRLWYRGVVGWWGSAAVQRCCLSSLYSKLFR